MKVSFSYRRRILAAFSLSKRVPSDTADTGEAGAYVSGRGSSGNVNDTCRGDGEGDISLLSALSRLSCSSSYSGSSF